MTSLSCGTEALMFGSLMMFASGSSVSAPSSARESGTRWASGSRLENTAKMRPDSEMSRVSTFTPACLAKACTMGKSE
jgi:hypothetical protein